MSASDADTQATSPTYIKALILSAPCARESEMRHKFYARKSPWAPHGGRITVQQAFKHWSQPYKREKATSVVIWKYERELASFRMNKDRHRAAVGMVRAFGSPTFFNGAYKGAEND